MQADLDATLRRIAVHAESDPSVNDARADRYRRADEIGRRARAEADQILERAADERRVLTSEVQRLHEEKEALRDEIASDAPCHQPCNLYHSKIVCRLPLLRTNTD